MLSLSLYAQHLNVGYSNASLSHVSKKDTMISMKLWIDEIMIDNPYTASFTFYNNPTQMAADFNEEELDYAIAQALDFVKYFDKSKLTNAFSGGMRNRDDENLVIVVPFDADIESISKLENPIIAVQQNDNLAKIYIETKIFPAKNIKLLKVKKRSAAILKLFFKKADLAIVLKKTFDFSKELNPQMGKKLKILEYSNLPAGVFGYFRKDFDKKAKDDVTKMAFNLINTPRGKQMMVIFQTNALVKIKVEDLKPIEKLYKEYLELKKGKK